MEGPGSQLLWLVGFLSQLDDGFCSPTAACQGPQNLSPFSLTGELYT